MPGFVLTASFPDCWCYELAAADAADRLRIYVEADVRDGHEEGVSKVLIYKDGQDPLPLAIATALVTLVRKHDLKLWALDAHGRAPDEPISLEDAFEWWTRSGARPNECG